MIPLEIFHKLHNLLIGSQDMCSMVVIKIILIVMDIMLVVIQLQQNFHVLVEDNSAHLQKVFYLLNIVSTTSNTIVI
jgi:hypothetical protein